MQKVSTGIVHGRFQPPHNGHIRYILAALEQTQHLYIGICTPEICSQEFADQTGFPCTAELNPFSHEARVQMISDSLRDEGISSDRYTCISFPSDYKNFEALIPNDTIFFISHSGTIDSRKKEYLEDRGYKTEMIMEIKEERTESGQKIRASIKEKNDLWKTLVPKAVQKYIEKGIL